MSVIRKEPYIEKVLKKLTSENFVSLKSAVNGSGSQVQASFNDLPESAVTPVIFKIAENDYKNGILVLQEADTGVEEVAFLIAYHRFQDLQLYSIDLTKHTIEKVNEYCDINELRRLLVDSSPEPTFENVYANNVFADDEIEFSSDTGDFGENAKERIKETSTPTYSREVTITCQRTISSSTKTQYNIQVTPEQFETAFPVLYSMLDREAIPMVMSWGNSDLPYFKPIVSLHGSKIMSELPKDAKVQFISEQTFEPSATKGDAPETLVTINNVATTYLFFSSIDGQTQEVESYDLSVAINYDETDDYSSFFGSTFELKLLF